VDEPARAIALWRDGVAGILTNRPDLILAARDRAADPLVEEP
jgi:glycerophosphoryl diester phosphodiesterase